MRIVEFKRVLLEFARESRLGHVTIAKADQNSLADLAHRKVPLRS
jgi:hypothetical protein